MVAFGTLGAVDDWQGLRGSHRGRGMTVRTKFVFQVILGLGAAWFSNSCWACQTCSCRGSKASSS